MSVQTSRTTEAGTDTRLIERVASKVVSEKRKNTDTSLKAIQRLIDAGFDRLDGDKTATTRYVFRTGNGTVIKIPQEGRLTRVNRKEVETWNEIRDPEVLCPVVDWHEDYHWIEMKECYFVYGRPARLMTALDEKVYDRGYSTMDCHGENIGVLPENREVVVFDYPDWELPEDQKT